MLGVIWIRSEGEARGCATNYEYGDLVGFLLNMGRGGVWRVGPMAGAV